MSDKIHVQVVVDTYDATYRHRTPEEFAAALVAASQGLSDAYVEAYEYYETFQICVSGWRERTPDEQLTLERAEYIQWLAAKGTYERGLEKHGGGS